MAGETRALAARRGRRVSAYAEGIVTRQLVDHDDFAPIKQIQPADGTVVDSTLLGIGINSMVEFFAGPIPAWATPRGELDRLTGSMFGLLVWPVSPASILVRQGLGLPASVGSSGPSHGPDRWKCSHDRGPALPLAPRRSLPPRATQSRSIGAPDRTELLDTLTEGVSSLTSSEQWRRDLDVQSRFHRYSFGDVLLIAAQFQRSPGSPASPAGRSLGRSVTKGESAIWILSPRRPPEDRIEEDEETARSVVSGPCRCST